MLLLHELFRGPGDTIYQFATDCEVNQAEKSNCRWSYWDSNVKLTCWTWTSFTEKKNGRQKAEWRANEVCFFFSWFSTLSKYLRDARFWNDLTSTLLWPHLHQSLTFSSLTQICCLCRSNKLVSPYMWNAILWGWEVHNRLRACHAFPDCQSPGSHSKVTFFYQR